MEKELALVLAVFVASTSSVVVVNNLSDIIREIETCQKHQFEEPGEKSSPDFYLHSYDEKQFDKKFPVEFTTKSNNSDFRNIVYSLNTDQPETIKRNLQRFPSYRLLSRVFNLVSLVRDESSTLKGEAASTEKLAAASIFAGLPSIIVSRNGQQIPYALNIIYAGVQKHLIKERPEFVRITWAFKSEDIELPELLVVFCVCNTTDRDDKNNTAMRLFLDHLKTITDDSKTISANVDRLNMAMVTSALTSWKDNKARTYLYSIMSNPNSRSSEPQALVVVVPNEYTKLG